MASLRDIRRRIKSVRNIQQITQAMQRVAFSRLRVAQQRTLASRPYAEALRDVLLSLPVLRGSDIDVLMSARPVRHILIIHITPDRSLCGALPGNVNRRLARFALEQTAPIHTIAVGRRGREFIVRSGLSMVADFSGIGDHPTADHASAIGRAALDEFYAERVDAVYVTYTQLLGTLHQEPELIQLLPVAPPEQQTTTSQAVQSLVEFEPEPREVLRALLPRYIDMQIYQALLESKASEHSARMVAMQNATDNARELVSSLTLSLNKARQAGITRELAEIVGGAAALE
ncbi:MAG: ATP synthase F1 subunit gamma [Chloroflexi bacterium]|nr:ATP synthase F1 subunit gamma [Chloroflexota bacterium]